MYSQIVHSANSPQGTRYRAAISSYFYNFLLEDTNLNLPDVYIWKRLFTERGNWAYENKIENLCLKIESRQHFGTLHVRACLLMMWTGRQAVGGRVNESDQGIFPNYLPVFTRTHARTHLTSTVFSTSAMEVPTVLYLWLKLSYWLLECGAVFSVVIIIIIAIILGSL